MMMMGSRYLGLPHKWDIFFMKTFIRRERDFSGGGKKAINLCICSPQRDDKKKKNQEATGHKTFLISPSLATQWYGFELSSQNRSVLKL